MNEHIKKVICLFVNRPFEYYTVEILKSYYINKKGLTIYLYRFKHYSRSSFLMLSTIPLSHYKISEISNNVYNKYQADWYVITISNECTAIGFINNGSKLKSNLLNDLIGGQSELVYKEYLTEF